MTRLVLLDNTVLTNFARVNRPDLVMSHGLFASDDADARRQARALNVPITGTIGILVLAVRQQFIPLAEGNALLSRLVAAGYYAPVSSLDDFL